MLRQGPLRVTGWKKVPNQWDHARDIAILISDNGLHTKANQPDRTKKDT